MQLKMFQMLTQNNEANQHTYSPIMKCIAPDLLAVKYNQRKNKKKIGKKDRYHAVKEQKFNLFLKSESKAWSNTIYMWRKTKGAERVRERERAREKDTEQIVAKIW